MTYPTATMLPPVPHRYYENHYKGRSIHVDIVFQDAVSVIGWYKR